MKVWNVARGISVRSCGDGGFSQDLPTMVVGKTLDLESGVLDAMNDLRRSSGVLHDVEPVKIFELLGGGELGLGQGYAALAPGGADSLYFDVALDFADGVARLNVVAFM